MLAIRRAHKCADDAPLERQHGKLCLWKTTTHNLKFTSFIKEKYNQNIKTKLKCIYEIKIFFKKMVSTDFFIYC